MHLHTTHQLSGSMESTMWSNVKVSHSQEHEWVFSVFLFFFFSPPTLRNALKQTGYNSNQKELTST